MLQVMMILSLFGCILTGYLYVLFVVRRGKLGKVKHRIGPLFNIWMAIPLNCIIGLFIAIVHFKKLPLPFRRRSPICNAVSLQVN